LSLVVGVVQNGSIQGVSGRRPSGGTYLRVDRPGSGGDLVSGPLEDVVSASEGVIEEELVRGCEPFIYYVWLLCVVAKSAGVRQRRRGYEAYCCVPGCEVGGGWLLPGEGTRALELLSGNNGGIDSFAICK
jgi:hypothetical protein